MQKLLLMGLLLGLLTACGENGVKITSEKNKKILLEKIYEKEDLKAKAEYKNIIKELQELADNGNQEAEEELIKWDKVEGAFIVSNMFKVSEETEEAVAKMRSKEGNGW